MSRYNKYAKEQTKAQLERKSQDLLNRASARAANAPTDSGSTLEAPRSGGSALFNAVGIGAGPVSGANNPNVPKEQPILQGETTLEVLAFARQTVAQQLGRGPFQGSRGERREFLLQQNALASQIVTDPNYRYQLLEQGRATRQQMKSARVDDFPGHLTPYKPIETKGTTPPVMAVYKAPDGHLIMLPAGQEASSDYRVSHFVSNGVFFGFNQFNSPWLPKGFLNLEMKYVWGGYTLIWLDKISPNQRVDFEQRLLSICFELRLDPNQLMAIFARETGYQFKSSTPNGGRVGLIQIGETELADINKRFNTNYTIDQIRSFSEVKYLDIVYLYFKRWIQVQGGIQTFADLLCLLKAPGKYKYGGNTPLTNVLYSQAQTPKTYAGNLSEDTNNDKIITLGEVLHTYSAAWKY